MQDKRADNQPSAKYITSIVAVIIVFVIGLVLGSWWSKVEVSNVSVANKVDYGYLNELVNQIESDYIDDLENDASLTYGAAKGIVEALDDTYSAFLDPEEAESYFQSNGSSYVGVGISLGVDGDYVSVLSVMEGSPALAAGILADDVFIEVDGVDVVGLTPQEVATLIRGEQGTSVKLKVFRSSLNKELEIDVDRQEIDLDNIEYEVLEDGVVKINIRKFTEGAEGNLSGAEAFIKQWDEVVEKVSKENPKSIIVDLRNNPGGFLSGVKYVAEEFLPTGSVIYKEKEKNSPEIIASDSRSGAFEDLPVVVLVNQGSASAAEIFAGALQDNDRAEVIGTETVGKGVEQKLITLDDGSVLLLVFRAWLTPNGKQVNPENPIIPDTEIEINAEAKTDTQLEAAIKALTEDN